jgi:hypothetical protein
MLADAGPPREMGSIDKTRGNEKRGRQVILRQQRGGDFSIVRISVIEGDGRGTVRPGFLQQGGKRPDIIMVSEGTEVGLKYGWRHKETVEILVARSLIRYAMIGKNP